ncbi:MAG: sigma-70 family RNA polymerase sigma factor [Lentisphaeria bacterium]|nr:sigma-70 family RNA polymerase sigma factor [Lentisphaeria bacterium]
MLTNRIQYQIPIMETLPSKTKDDELLARIRDGNTGAFDDMVIAYSPKLIQVAYGLLGNRQDAEEVVQDAFVRAYNALADFRGDSSLETWLHRITVNLARNKYHWNKRRGDGVNISLSEPQETDRQEADVDLPDSRLQPGQQLETEEMNANILKAIHYLPEKMRETIVLRHLDDLPYEKIAELLDCRVGTVKSRLARGRELLRNYLAALEEGKDLANLKVDDSDD